MTRPRLPAVVLLTLLAASCAVPGSAPRGDGPALEYRLSYDPDARVPVWRVELAASGLGGAHGLLLELEDWGEWLRLDGYYLRALESEPPLARREQRNVFDVVAPEGWDGRLRVSYELALGELGSPARESFGLLPYRAPSYCHGASANTLVSVAWDGMPAEVARSLMVDAPPGWTVLTGYAGVSRPGERVTLPAGTGNTVIGLGAPVACLREPGLEIVQWGGTRDVTPALADFAHRYLAACAASTGVPRSDVVRLVVTEPGMGGTRLDGAIVLGCPAGFDGERDAYTLHFLAHELFHDWLGGRLRASSGGEQMCWFWEGFTEYLSLWNLARAGLVSRAWFARRLRDHESVLESNEHWGATAFADPAVAWRDPGVEPLAYGGSALTAFALDVELRRAGGGGLGALIADLAARDGGRYSLESLRAWVEAHAPGFWAARFAAPARSTLRADLLAAGFEEGEEPAPFAYVGLRLDRPGPFGTVVAVDAEGPAHGRIEVGDRVSGLTPAHEPNDAPVALAPDFPFGLAYYEADAERVRIDVERGPEHLQVWVEPRRLEGRRAGLVPGPGLDAFFR